MSSTKNFIVGALSVLKITGSPLLYRYPYRTSWEGLRADWNSISGDISSVIGKLEEGHYDGKRR